MSRIIHTATVAALIWLASAPATAWADRSYIYEAVGSVTVAVGKQPSRPAVQHETVTSGMYIRTGKDSHAVLKFEDGQVVSIQADSIFQVREYIYNPRQVEKSRIVFSVFKGGLHFITGLIGQLNPKAFRLATSTATIGILGTDFFTVLTDDGLYTQVISGGISMTNAAGMSSFTAGNSSLTTSSTALPAAISPANIPPTTFAQIASIPVPLAVPGMIPPPVPTPLLALVPAPVAPSAAIPAPTGNLQTSAETGATPGGSAAGGATAALPTAAVAESVSLTTVAIGLGVAVGVAALVTTSTTHH